MKKFLGLLALFILALSSCTNELPDWKEPAPTDTIPITRTPDFLAYSGENVIGTSFIQTRSANPNSNQWFDPQYGNYKEIPAITEAERDKVLEWFAQHENPESVSLDWTDFFVQQLGYSEVPCTAIDGSTVYTGKSHMNQLAAGWINNPDEINNFNSNTQFNSTMLMENSSTSNFSYKQSAGSGNRWYDRFVIVEIDGSYYVGFDFYSHTEWEANRNEQVEADGLYGDWVVKITKAEHKQTSDEPTLPKEEQEGFDEVEINLSADSDLIAHLSIHVRAVTDVDVFIPIPVDYYCKADDMAIVQKHYDELMIHGGPESVEYNINGTTVTMNVEFKEDGIRVWTEGIDENVIDYCYNTYGDGITFEVWNYLNGTLDRSGLLDLLDQSTVTFTNPPSKYVNAFNKTSEGDKFEWDATVSPTQSGYNPPEEGLHYNGSPYNQIYTRK